MNEEKNTTEYLHSLKDISLSESSRARIEKELLAHAQFHPVREGVRVAAGSRSIRQVQGSTSLFGLRLTFMPLALLLAVFISGGVTFAAQGTVPGDALYPVKTEFNESVRSAFAIGANAETRLQTKLLAERLEEAGELQSENRLSGDIGVNMKTAVESQIESTASAATDADTATRVVATEAIINAVTTFNAMVENDTSLAIAVDALDVDTNTKTAISTSLASNPIDVAVLKNSTETRATALKNLLVTSSAEISTEVRTALEAKVDTALALVTDVSLEAEAEARTQITEASNLLGEVEAALTTMGTATIDTDTGTIIDIDFSPPPPAEPNRGDGETQNQNQSDTTTTTDVDVDGSVDTDIINVDADASLEATSGINL